ncbi:alpha/beta hydrolase [Micromonospora sp. NPDC047548]|uniref:alpha/beta hydrolase n=1 Tax=Micromonospora sp. NPDC047548 TaxID=3155624 RepID=UPI0033FE4793
MEFGLVHLTDPRLAGFVAESRAFYARRVAGRGPSSPEELRAMRAMATAPAPSYPPAVVEVVCTGGRSAPVRIHMPASGEVAGVFLEIHGGGFYLGSAAGSDVRNRNLADALGLAVVSVDYRLAPEHPWPAAPDDCETAALWLADHAEHRFGTTKLSIGGFSAGATLAMTALLRLRDRGITAYGSAVLQFGTYDLSAQTPAGRLIADEYFLDAYAGSVEDRTHPDLSPIYADVTGLPPVLVVVGADDVLLEDNLAMAVRLSAAGVDVNLRIYPASPHGFTGHATPMARAAMDDIESWLHRHLQLQCGSTG